MNPDGRKGKTGKSHRQAQNADNGLRFKLQQVAKCDFQIVCNHASIVFSKLAKIVRFYM
jgi:hypothetical protein